jgi:hypothetical protein
MRNAFDACLRCSRPRRGKSHGEMQDAGSLPDGFGGSVENWSCFWFSTDVEYSETLIKSVFSLIRLLGFQPSCFRLTSSPDQISRLCARDWDEYHSFQSLLMERPPQGNFFAASCAKPWGPVLELIRIVMNRVYILERENFDILATPITPLQRSTDYLGRAQFGLLL